MTDVQKQFDCALNALVAKTKADRCVLAAVLLGSMAHDTVWQRSDIDLLLVTEESKKKKEGLCLVEDGINIHAMIVTRSEFRRILEGSVQGSFMHSLLVKGRMLFSKDESLQELFAARHGLGERDRAFQILQRISIALASLAKAEKWFHVRKDYDYSAFWILKSVDFLAGIEMLYHGEVPAREVVQEALRLNPTLFQVIYTDLIEGVPTRERVGKALASSNAYLREHVRDFFAPIFDYLEEEDSLRSSTDINHHFSRHYNLENVDIPCEWLADEGFIHKLATPVRLTLKSQVDVEEAAYTYKDVH